MDQAIKQKGFEAIAITFERISEVEKRHEARYNKLAKNMEEGKVFKKDEKVLWKCLNCGHIHEGEEAPKACQRVSIHKDTLKYLQKTINKVYGL